jgi:hypothetical protein
MFGYAANEAISRDIALLMLEHVGVQEALARVLGGGSPPTKVASLFTGVCKDGSQPTATPSWS